MSVEETSVVDIISTDRATGEVILTISDHLDWGDSIAHQLLLQAKLNRYLAFVEGNEILEAYPQARAQPVAILIVFKFPPDVGGKAFLERVKPIVESAGLGFRYQVFTGGKCN